MLALTFYSLVKRRQRFPGTPTKPKFYKMVEIKLKNAGSRLPPGAWEEPAYKFGKLVGYWMQFQFDPYASDADYPKERFKPLGSDTWIEDYGC